MNRIHNVLCSSGWWARRVERELLPWGVGSLDLGDDVLEVGPGFGSTSRLLAQRPGHLTLIELEPDYCERLRRDLGASATVVQGDATRLPFEAGRFSAVVCFTMLHHIPSPALQDQAFAEAARVLRPGGTFAGTDSAGGGWLFRLIHVGDVLQLIDPNSLPQRLAAAGLPDAVVQRSEHGFRFRARKPQ